MRFDQKPDLQQVLEAPRSSWQLASSERWRLTPQVQVQTNSLENAHEDSSCGSPTFHPCWQHRSLSGCCLELWGVHGVQPDYQHQTTTTTIITTTMDDEEVRHASGKIKTFDK